MVKAKSILDIGTFTGYSAIALAQSAYCEQVISLDIDEECKTFVKKMINETEIQNKIRVIIGPAIKSLEIIFKQNKKFDLVFIDADKTSYVHYYNFIMENQLLNPNGIILCDNIMWCNDTILKRESKEGAALYDFMQLVKNDKRVEQLVLPIRDGILLITQKQLLK